MRGGLHAQRRRTRGLGVAQALNDAPVIGGVTNLSMRRERRMKAGDGRGGLAQVVGRQPASVSHLLKQGAVGKPAHLDDPVDGLAIAADPQGARGVAHDGKNSLVEVRRQRTIDGEFRFASRPPLFQRGHIAEGVTEASLELVDRFGSQEDVGHVRVDPFQWSIVTGRRTALECGHNVVLVIRRGGRMQHVQRAPPVRLRHWLTLQNCTTSLSLC